MPTLEAHGRVLAADVISALAVPPLDNSQMDGYAVRTLDVPAAGTTLRVSQRIAAGHVGVPLEPGTAARIFTGAPVPAGADAIVMQESCNADGDRVTLNERPQTWRMDPSRRHRHRLPAIRWSRRERACGHRMSA